MSLDLGGTSACGARENEAIGLGQTAGCLVILPGAPGMVQELMLQIAENEVLSE